jgi:acyl-CoA reductase-like NAD-dependent aldehyde dehydrogenase
MATDDGSADDEQQAAARAAQRLAESAGRFARAPLRDKVAALSEIRRRLWGRGHELARLGAKRKGLSETGAGFGEELLAGAVIIQRYTRLLIGALSDVREHGAPRIEVRRAARTAQGELEVEVMPHSLSDRALFMPYSIGVRLPADVQPDELKRAQAGFYQRSDPEGRVAAVLGAGNVASIPALDVLHQAFVEGRACALKLSPVNQYLGSLFEQIFAPLVELGGLQFVYGGAQAGKALLASSHVQHVHMTGSIETHDRIVWGPPGVEQHERKEQRAPLLDKTITSELGNISPALVVPGPYSERELTDVAESVAGMLFNNAAFNCNGLKLLVVPKSLASSLLARVKRLFDEQPPRIAYYPGAIELYRRLLEQRAEAQVYAPAVQASDRLPWTLLTGLSPESNALSFRLEPFCPLLSVVEIDERDPDAFLARSVSFVNDKVWGTLSAMLFVPPALERDASVRAAVERAIAELRYGAVAVNYWPALIYGLGTPPWGGHPSATLEDAQSGIGFVHNALMLERVQKVVLRGPLRHLPKPVWYPSHRRLEQLARHLFAFESSASPLAFLRTAAFGLSA